MGRTGGRILNFTVKATLPALALAATVCGSAMAEPEFDRTFTMVDEDACEVIGVTVGFHEQPPPDEHDGASNTYSVALKADEDPSACLISRVEFGRVRGVPDAAELAIKTMAADWDCAT